MAQRLKGRYGYPKDNPFKITFHPDRLDQPLRWKKPRRIFVVSMGDLFHEDVTDKQIDGIFERMTHPMMGMDHHTYLILTKRPERILAGHQEHFAEWPNIWLGVTCENQQAADERIPILLQIPAAVRFVSCEPMLSEIDFSHLPESGAELDWVICGGESGPGARPMHPDWARSIRDYCQAAGVPFFFKQWGNWAEIKQMSAFMATGRAKNGTHSGRYDLEYYDKTQANNIVVDNVFSNISVYRVGKKKAGRILDGRTWDEYPEKVL